MNKLKWVLAIGGLAAALALSVACLGARTDSATEAQPTTTTQPQTETRAAAQLDQAASQQGGIWVSGEGKLTLEPDLVLLSGGVNTTAPTVSEANAAASEAMAAVVAALKARDIEDKDIQTSRFNIYPQYDYRETTIEGVRTSSQVLVGYNVRNSVNVKVRDLDTVGQLIDEMVAAGGDSIRMDGISFTVEDPDAHMAELRELAVADAQAKAAHMAELAGVTLGGLTYLAESADPSYPSPYPVAARASFALESAAIAPSISPGELELSLTVQASFAIE